MTNTKLQIFFYIAIIIRFFYDFSTKFFVMPQENHTFVVWEKGLYC